MSGEFRREPDLLHVARPAEIDRPQRADLPRPAGEDRDHVGERDRLHEIVGHEHHGHAAATGDAGKLLLHDQLELGIERAERLVEQQRLGLVDQHAGQRRASPHAPGQFRWVVPLEALAGRPGP